jgi:hypothetical protein
MTFRKAFFICILHFATWIDSQYLIAFVVGTLPTVFSNCLLDCVGISDFGMLI